MFNNYTLNSSPILFFWVKIFKNQELNKNEIFEAFKNSEGKKEEGCTFLECNTYLLIIYAYLLLKLQDKCGVTQRLREKQNIFQSDAAAEKQRLRNFM